MDIPSSVKNARERAARGAKLLDEKFPRWHTRVDLQWLSMMHVGRCILGQLGDPAHEYEQWMTGGKAVGMQSAYRDMTMKLFGEDNLQGGPQVENGFLDGGWSHSLSERDPSYAELAVAWTDEVKRRLNGDAAKDAP